jgi:acyl-CoA synthetase (NDP forming)
MPHLSAPLLDRFVNVDYFDRMALVATLGGDIVGVARYDALDDDPKQAEVAFTVDDAHQGRGVATVLLEHLAAFAAERGLSGFVAETLPTNSRMLGVFRSAGFSDERRFDSGVVRVRFPIQPTPASLAAVHDRERKAAAASIRRMLRPTSVAVVGAGRRPLGIGHEVFRNILRNGFTGAAYPVNRAAATVASVRAYASVADVPDPVDLAVVVVPAEEVQAVVDQCADKGVASLVVMSEGFADAGPEGAAAERELVERARGRGMRLLGPNCMGVANGAADVRLNATLAQALPPAGRVGFMAQSGPLGVAIMDEARRRGLGMSSFVSAGNKADVSGNDLIQYWDEDPDTDIVLLYLESFGNPRTFARVARRLSHRKPVVAVKGARSAAGRLVAGTPWAVPMASEQLVDALFRHTGVIRVDTLAQLFDVASVLAHQPLPAGRRVAVVANAGGSGALVADACEDAGLVLPPLADATVASLRAVLGPRAAVTNPVTVAGTAATTAYEDVLGWVLRDEAVDAVIVSFLHPLAVPPEDVAAAVARAASGAAKPVLANFMAAEEAADALRPVPVFRFPEAAAQALARVSGLVEWRAKPEGVAPAFADVDRDAARAIVDAALAGHADGTALDMPSAVALLRTYGVPIAETVRAASADEAMDAAGRIGLPVALKVPPAAPPAPGGFRARLPVRLGLRTPADVARAWAELVAATGCDCAVVQAMVPEGVEVAVDVATDRSFGPMVTFGTSGAAGEVYGDREGRALPLTDLDAEELIRSVKGAPLLLGYRDIPPADVAGLRDLLLRVSMLTLDLPEVAAVSLDPILVSTGAAVAVDARVAVAPYHPLPELALRRLR